MPLVGVRVGGPIEQRSALGEPAQRAYLVKTATIRFRCLLSRSADGRRGCRAGGRGRCRAGGRGRYQRGRRIRALRLIIAILLDCRRNWSYGLQGSTLTTTVLIDWGAAKLQGFHGWTYGCDMTIELYPAVFMIVKASAPDSPKHVRKVCLSCRYRHNAEHF